MSAELQLVNYCNVVEGRLFEIGRKVGPSWGWVGLVTQQVFEMCVSRTPTCLSSPEDSCLYWPSVSH